MSGITSHCFRYQGSKWRIAPWIIENLPPHKIYCEPFGGSAAVLMRKKPSGVDVYNDLEDAVVKLFRVLKDEELTHRLCEELLFTPYSRTVVGETIKAGYDTADDVEVAKSLLIRAWMGYSPSCIFDAKRTGFGGVRRENDSGNQKFRAWCRLPDYLKIVHQRWREVIIENRDAKRCMELYDGPTTCFMVDPPYLTGLWEKSGEGIYTNVLSDSEHVDLLSFLKTVKGHVVVCGYPNELYDKELAGWVRLERQNLNQLNQHRTECIWIKPETAKCRTKQLSII